jgi:hypothetical protein
MHHECDITGRKNDVHIWQVSEMARGAAFGSGGGLVKQGLSLDKSKLTVRGAGLPAAMYSSGLSPGPLGLARALVMQGDTAGAKQAYHDFFNTWKNADPNLPQLAQAKAELSALK